MKPAHIFRGLPPIDWITKVEPVRVVSAAVFHVCNHCHRAMQLAGTPHPHWECGHQHFTICEGCYGSLTAAIDEVWRSLGPLSKDATLHMMCRVAFLRHLATAAPEERYVDVAQRRLAALYPQADPGYSDICGWCMALSGDHPSLETASQEGCGDDHAGCRRQMARCVSVAAVREARAIFIGCLPLPGDVQSVIMAFSVAACDVWATVGATAGLLLDGYAG